MMMNYMFNVTTVVFDGPSPPFISQTLRDGTPQVQIIIDNYQYLCNTVCVFDAINYLFYCEN